MYTPATVTLILASCQNMTAGKWREENVFIADRSGYLVSIQWQFSQLSTLTDMS